MAETTVAVTPLRIQALPLGVVTFSNGKAMNLTVGVGSGAFHHASDAPGRIWTITDRGPSIGCSEAQALIGLDAGALCNGDPAGRIFPLPGFTPTIYGLDITVDGAARVTVTLPLKGRSGRPITGIPNPLRHASTEPAFDINGHPIPFNPSGLDTEALVKLSDGSFWIADEYGPSIALVAPDGTVLRRLVPKGLAADLAEADYDVVESLPAILLRRDRNRGIEGLAISPDERFLFIAMQAPLTVPDDKANFVSSDLRILKLDRQTGLPVGEYVYRQDPAESFAADNARKLHGQRDVRVSEIVAVGPDRLMVLERIDRASRLYLVDLARAAPLDARFDDPGRSPALEQMPPEALAAENVFPLAKSLLIDSRSLPKLARNLEGIALMSDHELIVVNDNDFGITGAETRIARLTFSDNILR